MLSLWKLRVGAESYYIGQVAQGLDDYYTGHGEAAGRWVGAASSGLGLGLVDGDAVSGEDLQAVLAGLQPGTGLTPNGEQLRTWRNRVPGFDLTFSAPKSLSVLYALADPLVRAQVVEATDAAVGSALGWLEREACFVRRGSNSRAAATGPSEQFGTRRLSGAGFVAAAFRHRTSRAGDPQLHTHVLVANITRGPDMRWTALDGQPLYRSIRPAGAVYQTVLRAELTARLGVAWTPVRNDVAEIAGIPHRVLRLFSKRRIDIEDELARTGESGPAAADEAALATRPPKATVDGEGLYQRWQTEATDAGFGPEHLDRLLADVTLDPTSSANVEVPVSGERSRTTSRTMSPAVFAGRVAETLVTADSTFTCHQVTTALAALLPAGATAAGLDRMTAWVLGQPELVPIAGSGDAGFEQRWTSRHLLRLEAELLAALQPSGSEVGVVPGEVVDRAIASAATLGGDQADTVRRVTGQGLGVEVIVGRAGTGKTSTMSTVRAVFEDAGYRVLGVATSARAARELADGAGIEATTIARMRRTAPVLSSRDVIVVDEAAMTNTVDLHWVITTARAAGAKVILVGDHRQLPEIGAGGGFAAAVDTVGDRVAELTINRRQQAPWEHDALEQLRDGDVAAAFDQYRARGRVIVQDQVEQLHAVAVTDWLTAHTAGRHALLLAGTRNQANALNRHARTMAAEQLHGPCLEVRDCEFQAGDRILLLHNAPGQWDLDRNRSCRVDNGMIGTVTAVNPVADTLDIELDNGRHIRLARDYLLDGHVDHGYAATVHKAQGLTCDEVYVVGPAGLYREAVYVAMSRARHGAWIYATTRDAAHVGERPHSAGIPLPTEHALDPDDDLVAAVEQSRVKRLASSHTAMLDRIADLAAVVHLGDLAARRRHIRTTTRQLIAAGFDDPQSVAARLDLARRHRATLYPGGRVHAADWGNVGVVIVVFDRTGSALVEFTSDSGRRRTKEMEWADITPLDHPDPVEVTDAARDYFALADSALAEIRADWNRRLAGAGIDPDDPVVVPAAIDMRRRRIAHALTADPPDWLTWWLGPRPYDPAGAQAWDDEIGRLAAWRDGRQLPDDQPGYGPRPDEPDLAARWQDHLDRTLAARGWLVAHTGSLEPGAPPPLDPAEIRVRLSELDDLLAGAPPDQRRIIDDINNGTLTPADVSAALAAAAATQHERCQWILENWPYVIEHAELTRLERHLGPLDHWPQPPPSDLDQALYRQVVARTVDTPEDHTLDDLDQLIAAIDPRQQLADTTARLNELYTARNQLTDDRHGVGPAQQAIIDDHVTRLNEQIHDIDLDRRRHLAGTSLWNLGHRTHELVDAVARRSNHLAHRAIVDEEPWIYATITAWNTATTRSGDDEELHRLIVDIAAWRERHHHTGPEPLAAHFDDLDGPMLWQRLHPTPTPAHHTGVDLVPKL